MFKAVDLSKSMKKGEFDEAFPELKQRLGELQRQVHDAGVPIMVVFEGWEATSMVGIINQFLLPLDPRGFASNNIGEPDWVEARMPFMWRFWMRTPWKGQIAIFDRSWYSRAVTECLDDGKCKALPHDTIEDINRFEKTLTDGGTVVIKLFLHTSKERNKEPDKKFSDLEACGLIQDDLNVAKHYRKHLPLLEGMMEQTDLPYAPWTIVESDDKNHSRLKTLRTIIEAAEKGLE